MDHHEILELLKIASFASLVGVRESEFFEAKGPSPYDLSEATGRYELAKDVSAFANADGGIIVIGLGHVAVAVEDTEEVSELLLIEQTQFSVSQLRGIVKSHIYPAVSNVDIAWIPSTANLAKGLAYIFVPSQPEEQKFFLVTKVVEEGVSLKENVFGVFRRVKAHNVPLQAHELARYIRDGRSPNAQRLTRIEAKLDSLLPQPNLSESPAAKLDERLKDI